jgi:diguanylate cyclase (GGDEF)-like protein/PAS domain S-box-containing protein
MADDRAGMTTEELRGVNGHVAHADSGADLAATAPAQSPLLSRINAAATALVVAACLLLPPGIYAIAAYSRQMADMYADVHILADTIEAAIVPLSETGQMRSARIEELLSHHIHVEAHGTELVRIIDGRGEFAASAGRLPRAPVATQSAPLTVAGKTLARVELQRSLRPILINTGLLALVGLALAAAAFLSLRVIPLRAVGRAYEALYQRDAALASANTLLKQSEEQFRAIFDNARDGIALADLDTNLLIVANTSFRRMLGYTPAEISRLSVDDLHPAAALPQVLEKFARQARGEINIALDVPIKRKDGSVFLADINSAPVTIGGKQYLLGIFRDIAERKAVEEAVHKSEEKYRNLVESTTDYIWEIDASGRYTYYSPSVKAHLGYGPAELIGKRPFDFMSPAEAKRNAGFFASFVAAHRPFSMVESTFLRKDGSAVVMETSGVPIFDKDGAYRGYRGIDRDVTERKSTAEALKQSETRFKAIFDNARDGIALVNFEDKSFAMANHRFCQMLGYSAGELIKLGLSDVHPPSALAHIEAEFADYAGRETHGLMDIPLKRKDGSTLFVDINSAPLDIGGRRYVLGIFRDATERKAAEEAVRKSEEKYRNLVESTTDYIWEIDASGRYTYYSPSVEADLGYEPAELIGKTPFDLMPPLEAKRVADQFAQIAAARQPFSMLENTLMRKDGSEIVMETSGVPIFDKDGAYCGYRGIERDITQRKHAEEALQKRDALMHAVAFGATELLTSPSLDEAIKKSLESVSKTIRADRMLVLERPAGHIGAPILRYIWESSNITFNVDRSYFENPSLQTDELSAWEAPLRKGRVVTSDVRTATGDVKGLLLHLGIKKNLTVPVMVDGKFWGLIGVDSCDQECIWTDFEIETLQTLAELIGNAIQRDRYVKEITDANQIVQNTPTILYRLRGEPALPMIYVSQNIKLFGYEPDALIASPELYKSLIHPADTAAVRDAMAHALENHSKPGTTEFRFLTARGSYRWIENRFTPIHDASGRLVEVEGLLIDITERKQAEERIAQLARTDSLTGLANRTTFIEGLQRAFASSRRGAPQFAVLYLDLDRFKDINDTLGHPVGDRLLVVAADRIRSGIRETDTAARFGGDEFAILLSEITDLSDAGRLAEKLRVALAKPAKIDGNELRITASVGIAIYDPHTAVPEDLLAQADVALYRAKEEGRDQYRFHSEELDIQVREEVTLANELRLALSRNQFKLYYQPQVELHTGRIVGMEALIRWSHPTRGLLSPPEFIPTAERTGTIVAIGKWVLEHACEQMAAWRRDGIAPPSMAVNLSSIQIRAANEFVQLVTDTLTKWHLTPKDLELDVTESTLARAALAQNDVLGRLQALGVRISIDDFGSKYSSLDYLKTYQVNRVKIPQTLTRSAGRNPQSAAMVRAIVGIARELNIEVIAQGVETEDQWSFLTQTSPVSKVQGYYYSEPVPADGAQKLLRRGQIGPGTSWHPSPPIGPEKPVKVKRPTKA